MEDNIDHWIPGNDFTNTASTLMVKKQPKCMSLQFCYLNNLNDNPLKTKYIAYSTRNYLRGELFG